MLRLYTKAFLSYLNPASGNSVHYVLRDDEIIKLIDMLANIESSSSSDISLILEMMKSLTRMAENISVLLQWKVLDLISPLTNKLTDEEQQKILAELTRKFIQYENGSYNKIIDVGDAELDQKISGT